MIDQNEASSRAKVPSLDICESGQSPREGGSNLREVGSLHPLIYRVEQSSFNFQIVRTIKHVLCRRDGFILGDPFALKLSFSSQQVDPVSSAI